VSIILFCVNPTIKSIWSIYEKLLQYYFINNILPQTITRGNFTFIGRSSRRWPTYEL